MLCVMQALTKIDNSKYYGEIQWTEKYLLTRLENWILIKCGNDQVENCQKIPDEIFHVISLVFNVRSGSEIQKYKYFPYIVKISILFAYLQNIGLYIYVTFKLIMAPPSLHVWKLNFNLKFGPITLTNNRFHVLVNLDTWEKSDKLQLQLLIIGCSKNKKGKPFRIRWILLSFFVAKL